MLFLSVLFIVLPMAQTLAPVPQASSIVQSATTAQFGSTTITDVQLNGTVISHFGKTDQGTITLQADTAGHSKVALNLGAGSRSEYSSGHSEAAACTWTGADSQVHPVADHNCMTDGAWFLPLLSLPNAQQDPQATLTYSGTEQKNGATAEHLVTAKAIPTTDKTPAKTKALSQSLAKQNLFIDSTTSLPVALTFNVHPDNDAGRDIPVEIRFSDYRDVNGVKVPFHIEKSMNGSTVLEINVETATFNTGALATAGAAK